MCIIVFTIYRGVEQLVARRAHNPEVAGSNPASATKEKPLTVKACRAYMVGGLSFYFPKK